MSKIKTISGHYDTAYSIAHNNRFFVTKNVDIQRTPRNYNCVAAGEETCFNPDNPRHISEFWKRYKDLSDLYWQKRSIEQLLAYRRYQEHLEYMRKYCYSVFLFPNNAIESLITLLFLPLLVPCGIYLNHKQQQAKAEWEQFKEEQWLQDLYFKASKASLRSALYAHDHATGTKHLYRMDCIVTEMTQHAETLIQNTPTVFTEPEPSTRFATLEEIYGKLYEPSFREFQSRQRPCRRYHGTYLEQIREGQQSQIKNRQQSKNAKSRKTAEAIEMVFCIGDMDNTGYAQALPDAKRSEELLKDFCNYLMENPKLCCVTTRELNDPNWSPPFKNGLIVLNLTMHADEATPGVHLTCIPYSRNCSRGPKAQASLGRVMTGMGYPSTWKDILDEKGKRIPKRNRKGEIIRNKDGTVRCQQEPDQQGIIDWIEDQKHWLQKEMRQRYGWEREYKGSHPRGNLSTPDYQAARARERKEAFQQILTESLTNYDERVYKLSKKLDNSVAPQWINARNQETIERF
ncbi:MAG: hypothetical protein IJB59_09700 [Oscillospiraceae bacterium]|nr:hypothetical protein [Oscillospiraceae bacterium]